MYVIYYSYINNSQIKLILKINFVIYVYFIKNFNFKYVYILSSYNV